MAQTTAQDTSKALDTAPATGPAATEHHDYDDYPGMIRYVVALAVMLGTILEVLDTSIVNVAIPDMMGNLGATLNQISWVSTGYIIANVIILPLTGWLSGHFGRKKYLAFSIILFTVASFFCGTARTLQELVLFRILQGAGGAALLSTAQATLMEIFPPAQLGMVQALFGIGVMVGPTVGPTLGGWITDNYSWPWIFFINIPIGILATTLTLLFLKDSRFQRRASRVDITGIALLAVGIGCLQTMLEEGNREGWLESTMIRWLLTFAVLGVVSFIWWELHTDQPAVNLRVLRNRGLAAGTAFAAILGFGLYGGVFVLPVFLQNLRHFTAAQTGWILLPGGLATAFTLPFTGRLLGKFPARNLVFIGTCGFICSMLMLHNMTMDTGASDMFWPLVLRGASMGFLFAPLSLAALVGLKGRDVASGTGLYNLMRQLGGSAGIAALSTVLDHRQSYHRAVLSEHINLYNPVAQYNFQALTRGLVAKGSPLVVAKQQALAIMSMNVQGQAAVLSFEDIFLIIAVVFIFALPLVFVLKKVNPKDLSNTRPTAH